MQILFETIITYLDYLTILFAFVTMCFVIVNFFRNQKRLDKINIYFNDIKLDLDIVREDITRSEIQGIFGVLQINPKDRYSIEYLSKIEYLDDIYKIKKYELDRLNIKVTKEELKQFNIDNSGV